MCARVCDSEMHTGYPYKFLEFQSEVLRLAAYNRSMSLNRALIDKIVSVFKLRAVSNTPLIGGIRSCQMNKPNPRYKGPHGWDPHKQSSPASNREWFMLLGLSSEQLPVHIVQISSICLVEPSITADRVYHVLVESA